eukprot:COSAG01_NODE_2775_length_7095_cov_4.918811_4_plen_149_part_00
MIFNTIPPPPSHVTQSPAHLMPRSRARAASWSDHRSILDGVIINRLLLLVAAASSSSFSRVSSLRQSAAAPTAAATTFPGESAAASSPSDHRLGLPSCTAQLVGPFSQVGNPQCLSFVLGQLCSVLVGNASHHWLDVRDPGHTTSQTQ